MATLQESIKALFQAHQDRLAAVRSAENVKGLAAVLNAGSASQLVDDLQKLIVTSYSEAAAEGRTLAEKVTLLAGAVASLVKDVNAATPDPSLRENFVNGSNAAAIRAFLGFFPDTPPTVASSKAKPKPAARKKAS